MILLIDADQKATECDFNQNEIAERIIEFVVASTPFKAFQKNSLDTFNGYTTEDVPKEGRKYEAMIESRQYFSTPESGVSSRSMNAIKTTRKKNV